MSAYGTAPKWMFNQEAFLETLNESGTFGPTFSAKRKIACKFEPYHREIPQQGGDAIVAQARLFTLPDVRPSIGSRVEFDGKTYEVVETGVEYNAKGKPHHVESVLQ